MSYKDLNEFEISSIQDFKQIFTDNSIIYNNSILSDEMLDFLNGKVIIFKEGTLFHDMKVNNIYNIFDQKCIKKVIKDNNIFKFINGKYEIGNKFSSVIFKDETINISSNIDFINCQFDNVNLKSSKSQFSLNINGGKINTIDFDDISNINKISITNIEKIDSIIINNLNNINSLDINIKEIGYLLIENTFFDGKKYAFRDCIINKAEFLNCNFGETQFNGINFEKLGFKYTTLNNCIFNNITFPNKLEKTLFKNTFNTELSDNELKDNYRQLKHVMDKNGNHTEANKYFVLEMDYLRKSLSNKSFPVNNINNGTYNNTEVNQYGEKVILYITKAINNYGLNWILNIFWLISTALLFAFGKFFYQDYIFNNEPLSKTLMDINILHKQNIQLFGDFIGNMITYSNIIFLGFIVGLIILITRFNIFLGLISFMIFLGTFISPEIYTNFINLLLNPAYGLKIIPNINDNIGLLFLLIYKIIYAVLVYQLIIALKRTTRR